MQIKRLRLTGFKSFVDPADLRIEPGLTGIVGPNGCGKSNLLEALRWAMGENSAKSMRGAGMEDVIFAGTASRPQRDFAEVSILAEQPGEGELEVVRRIERGAGSAYRVNGRDVRAKDVALLFADAATGAHSPALVSQGRIAAIIQAKPAERRQMLEEAAGISGLHVRRKDAEQKLRATENNLDRLQELMAEQEARTGALRRQARQAERYRELSDRIRIAEARSIFARWRDAAQEADRAKEAAKAALDRVNQCNTAQEAALQDQREKADALARARSIALSNRDMAGNAQHELAALRARRGGIERRIAELRQASQQLAGDRAREATLARDATQALGQLARELTVLDLKIAEGLAQIPARDAALTNAEHIAREGEVLLAQAMARQAEEAAETRVADAALAAAKTRAERAARELARVRQELDALGATQPLIDQRDAAAKAREAAQKQAESARTALSQADTDERTAIEQRSRAQSLRATAHAEVAQLESEAAALIRATKPSGKDRLLDQLNVASGYERALAAAIGDDLEAGLNTQDDRHWAGAATQDDDPAPVIGTTPLSQYVTAPPAIARRLAQIFVAEQDQGQRLAVGQRLVTLDGVLRRWDGYVARSGGAAAAERLERVNRLQAIAQELPKARDARDAADAELKRIEERISDAKIAATAARRALETAEATIRTATRDEDRAAAALERLEGQQADLDSRYARHAAEDAEAQGELAQAQSARDALPDDSVTREQVRALTAQVEQQRAATATARAERSALDRDIAAARERHAAAQAERAGWTARSGEAGRRIAEMDARAAELDHNFASVADRPAELDAALAKAQAAYDRAQSDMTASQRAEREAEAALKACEVHVRAAADAFAQAREARATAAANAEHNELRRMEMARMAGDRFEMPPPLLPDRIGFVASDVGAAEDEWNQHERLLTERERIGPVNLVAERELAELLAASETATKEREELTAAVHRLRGSIGTLNREGRQRLLAAFEAVDQHFRRLFTHLFGGGIAHLALIDSDDPLEAGLEIMAQPPGKKLQSLTLLSGGEQALTAVALIFALFLTNPAPICVLDEVDAPLDDANIERFCDLLDVMTRETATRYLIVTHNAATMSRMDRLFGVTMVERGISRLVSVDLGKADALIAAAEPLANPAA